MRLTFLGTGTSFGVPQIGCGCAVCRSTDPRDKRNRSGALVEADGSTILIDTPPELRLQLIAGGFSQVDAVLYTHEHADHTNGIDDLRIFSVRQRRALPHLRPGRDARPAPRRRFGYIFDDVRPLRGHVEAELGAPRARARRGGRGGRRVGAAAGVPARAHPGVRLSVRRSGLPHRREVRPRGGAAQLAGLDGSCSTRSGGGRTRPTSASAKRSRPRRRSAPGAPISPI